MLGDTEMSQALSWMTAIVFGAVAASLHLLGTYGRYRWAETTPALLSQMEAARIPTSSLRYNAQEIQGLPAPVQRYFRAVLKDGQPIVTGVAVQHIGTFNVTALSSRAMWFPFTSEQSVVTRRPGFVWNARMALLPCIAIHVHDAYVAGTFRLKLLRYM